MLCYVKLVSAAIRRKVAGWDGLSAFQGQQVEGARVKPFSMSNLHGHPARYTVSAKLVEQALADLGGDANIESIVRYVGKQRRATMSLTERISRPFTWRFGVLKALQQNPRCVQDNEGSTYWRLKSYQRPQLSVHEAAAQVFQNVRNAFTARVR